MKKAQYFEKLDEKTVRCELCPHYCIINDNKKGICDIRVNENGELYSLVYGKASAVNTDPIEKKPLYHFFPGQTILSVGSIGCNFKCKFCQNYDIAQPASGEFRRLHDLSPQAIIDLAKKEKSFGIAYTYNEPIVWYEYMLDTAKLAHENQLKNVVVSNGFINEKPLAELLNYIDAFNIDLKAFENDFYKKFASGRIDPVKDSLIKIKDSGCHVEITNLVIPGLNDDKDVFQKMVKWISGNLGKDTPLHLSRYFPTFKLDIESTPPETLLSLFEIADSELDHVYLGNFNTVKGKNTYCSNCGNLLIKRSGYHTELRGINNDGECTKCKHIDIINK